MNHFTIAMIGLSFILAGTFVGSVGVYLLSAKLRPVVASRKERVRLATDCLTPIALILSGVGFIGIALVNPWFFLPVVICGVAQAVGSSLRRPLWNPWGQI